MYTLSNKRCSAPCVGHINEEEYSSTVKDAIDFISGKSRRIQKIYQKRWRKQVKSLIMKKLQ